VLRTYPPRCGGGTAKGTEWRVDKVITIPAERADPAHLPPALQPFGAVPPLVSDIDLSVDDQMLYVSCRGTGRRRTRSASREGYASSDSYCYR
jgi:hypothetical protein